MQATGKRPRPYHAMADRIPTPGRDAASVRRRIEALEQVLERLFVVPGLNKPVGLDVLLDILPFAGDLIGAILGSYLVWEARNLGVSKWQMARMFGNVGIDFVLGSIPWVGAIPDLMFRSNSRNLRIIRKHLDRYHPETVLIEN